jgi:hypothetical protein
MPATERSRVGPAVRTVANVASLALATGLLGGAFTIVKEYRHFLEEGPTAGPLASVDFYLRSAGMGTSDQFLHGLAQARLPLDADVTYVAPVAGCSRLKFWQTYYVASYLMYPRRVWPIAWCETPGARECEPFPAVTDLAATIHERGGRYVLIAGEQKLPLDHVRAHRLSPSLTLFDLP